jgi:uncharacterized protein (UPF0333 family)
MRQFITALGLVVACSAVAVTTTAAQAKPAAKAAAKSTVATHSTSGTVKSIDGNTLVITRPGTKKNEMTFAVNGSTQKDSTVGVGSRVTVRYQSEGKSMIATAITERPTKQMAPTKSTSKPATKKY